MKRGLGGFLVGAALGLAGHLVALIASAEGRPHDEASRRVSAELVRIAGDNARFVVALTIGVMVASGLLGALVALALRFAAPRLRRGFWTLTAAATALGLALAVVRAFLRQPALLEPSLGGAHGPLAPSLFKLARNFSPRAIDLIFFAAAAVALALGIFRRRAALRETLSWFTQKSGDAKSVARTRRRALVVAALVAASVAGVAWPRRARAPALLVVAADSLRPDHFDARTAPHLLALEARGTTFDTALAPIARTTPSWISILTGLYPHSHGVRDMFPRRELRPAWLDYLPRRLRASGWRTVLATDYAGDFFPLFDAGFERAITPPTLTLPLVFQREVVTRSPLALALLDDALGRRLFPVLRYLMTNSDPARLAREALAELDGGDARPTALFVFFSTTHVPFAAPAPFWRAPDAGYDGPHRYAYDAQRLADVTASDTRVPDADMRQIRALYDGALAAVDDAAEKLIARADEKSTIVLFADHGENLFEPGTTTHHGKWFKGGDETLRVPLAFVGPGVPAGKRVPETVSLVDISPTVAELLKLPPTPADGRSLAPAFAGALAPRDVFAETGLWLAGPAEPDGVRYPPLPELLEADPRDGYQLVLKARYEDISVEAKHRMLRRGSLKLIYFPTVDGARYQLFDLAADPTQQHDLAPTHPEFPALEKALLKFLARDPERELDARDHVVRRID